MRKTLYLAGVCGIVAMAAGFGYTQNSRLAGRRVAPTASATYAQDAVSKFPTDHRPGLFEVHRRVLWDAGWMVNMSGPVGPMTYYEWPENLYYGQNWTLFLSPLQGYGIPEPGPGATRKTRLYVNYGDQWMCNGTPTVTVGDVEFELPKISGHYAAMGANWSQFRDLSEYEHLGHAPITMHLKDFVWAGSHCGAYPGTGKPKGVVYRIEAVFYDEYPFE